MDAVVDSRKKVARWQLSAHTHDVVYYGVMNINDRDYLVGSVDVWRCRSCRSIFVDEKRITEAKLPTKLGFDELPTPEHRWTVFVCSDRNGLRWSLKPLKVGEWFEHICPVGGQMRIEVESGFKLKSEDIDVQHTLLLVEEHVNENVDLHFSPGIPR